MSDMSSGLDDSGHYCSGELGSGYETLNLFGCYDDRQHAPRPAAILVVVEDMPRWDLQF